MVKQYYVYILTNWKHKVMYVGVTNDLNKRLYQHQHQLCDGFTKKYNVNKLVYYEVTESIESAIVREKQLKGWRREKKNLLVESVNPTWQELNV